MKMIPPVRATEQGKAQIVNRHCRIVVLSGEAGRAAWRKSFWKNASERVRIPYVRSDPNAFGVLFRVAYFGSGAQNGR